MSGKKYLHFYYYGLFFYQVITFPRLSRIRDITGYQKFGSKNKL